MWALEYEVDELQHKFADSIGTMDLDNLDVDFIEDMMLKAKPLQSVLNVIRGKQIVSDHDTNLTLTWSLPSALQYGQITKMAKTHFPPSVLFTMWMIPNVIFA